MLLEGELMVNRFSRINFPLSKSLVSSKLWICNAEKSFIDQVIEMFSMNLYIGVHILHIY